MNPLKLEPSLNPLKMDRVDEGRLKAGLFLYPTLLSLLSPFQYLLRVVKNLIQFPLSVLTFQFALESLVEFLLKALMPFEVIPKY